MHVIIGLYFIEPRYSWTTRVIVFPPCALSCLLPASMKLFVLLAFRVLQFKPVRRSVNRRGRYFTPDVFLIFPLFIQIWSSKLRHTSCFRVLPVAIRIPYIKLRIHFLCFLVFLCVDEKGKGL